MVDDYEYYNYDGKDRFNGHKGHMEHVGHGWYYWPHSWNEEENWYLGYWVFFGNGRRKGFIIPASGGYTSILKWAEESARNQGTTVVKITQAG